MRSATAVAASAPMERSVAHPDSRMRLSERDESLLKIDLSDLVLPNVNDLQVDGLNNSWWSRLFGRR